MTLSGIDYFPDATVRLDVAIGGQFECCQHFIV